MTDAAPAAAGDAAAAAAAAPAPAPAAPAAPPAAAPVATPATAAAAAAPGLPAAPAAGAPATVDTTGWPQAAIDAYTKTEADARRFQKEAGDARIQSKQNAAAEERKRIMALLDPEAAAGEPPTADQLAGVIEQNGQTITSLTRDGAATEAAMVAQVNPTKLPYLKFLLSSDQAYLALDPKTPEFGASLSSIIAAKVAGDPTLKLTGSVVASGVESLGGANGAAAITQEQFNAMPVSARTELYRSDRAAYDRFVAGQSA